MTRRVFRPAVIVALLGAMVGVAVAETSPAEWLLGSWQTQKGDARILIERCADGLCGRIVWMRDPRDDTGAERQDVKNPEAGLRDRPVQGLTILRIGETPDANGVHGVGRIYDPKSGRTYRCTMRQDGADALKMRGYLGISLLGRTTRWTRVPEDGRQVDTRLSDGR